ncbi:uncharacterized protein KQ657_001338 [Scheffersomyces spartinae]|uniref:Uncharacterized protein n=1 Tax=Scheffersomyces spartinae TaxID=45513 RepID=A0A9P8AHL1_9ASCO|nr:uncharacterized protein KQ657_001338 [Scheffersomyces spartinae]KAG7192881.1 hypothetical protein KQ657_001338 [Scheffersomyces spartinae]
MSTLTKEKKAEYQDQLWKAAVTGLAKGLLVGLVTGFYINYKFNWGVNTKFFRTPYRFWYLMSWTIAGLAFDTDIAKHKISKQMALEREIRRTVNLSQEIGGIDIDLPK